VISFRFLTYRHAAVLGAAGFGAMLFYPPELCRITAPVIGNQELCFLFINWAMFSISECASVAFTMILFISSRSP